MTAKIDTVITCDGGDKCPLDTAYGGDASYRSASIHRSTYWIDGWVYRKGKDYCPACAERLGFSQAKEPKR